MKDKKIVAAVLAGAAAGAAAYGISQALQKTKAGRKLRQRADLAVAVARANPDAVYRTAKDVASVAATSLRKHFQKPR